MTKQNAKAKGWKMERDTARQNKAAKRNIFAFTAADKRDGVEKKYY